MAGLILAGIGKGIADAGSTMANIGIRGYETREAARLRSAEKDEDRLWREEQKELDRDRQDERDRMYRRTAEQQAAGNKGTGGGMKGVDPADLEPGGKLAAYIAGEAGMTVPEYEKQISAMKTGNMSGYETIVGARADEEGPSPIKALPEGFKKEFDAKAKMLSQLAMTYVTGSESKNIAEAKQTGLITNTMEGVLAGTITPTKAGQATAVGKGVAPFGGDSNVTRNVLEGGVSVTPVGESAIAENKAQAGAQNKLAEKHGEEIIKIREDVKKIQAEIPEVNARTKKIQAETGQVGKDGGKDTDKTQERLSSVVNATNATIRSLEETKPPASSPARAAWDTQYADALALRAEATRLQKEALGARAAPPAAEKPAAEKPAAKLSALPTGAKYIGMSKGKKVYELPNGSRYIEP